MRELNPSPPFVWPEVSVLEESATYQHNPPFEVLAVEARSAFGIVSAVTMRGIEAIAGWLENNHRLQMRLVVTVYPACDTREKDLSRLFDVVIRWPQRLSVRIHPLQEYTDRSVNALCFLAQDFGTVYMATGPTDNLGLRTWVDEHLNFVFQPEPVLFEGFRRYFDWLWLQSRDITTGMTQIPALVLAEGTQEGARLWQDYLNRSRNPTFADVSIADPDRVSRQNGIRAEQAGDSQELESPTEGLGFPRLDELAEFVADLYGRGVLVSIDKLSRIPPLDAPLNPSLIGDPAEFHRGSVSRRVSMRVSIIDETTLKEIEKRRKGVHTLLEKFTFALADDMRWIPNRARALFESELRRINAEGQNLIAQLLAGDIDGFIRARRGTLRADIKAMQAALGRPGEPSESELKRVSDDLRERLEKAQRGSFAPKLTYTKLGFEPTESTLVSPWGQAFSLLCDIASFPRQALTDRSFISGLGVDMDELIKVMNVADDALWHDIHAPGIKAGCKLELGLLARIREAPVDARERCDLVRKILAGCEIAEIDSQLFRAASAKVS